jgi:AcrR family transcriptional regulator
MVGSTETLAPAEQVARVAARLFAERGFDATSVREIVEAAGVTKPTLYYHFGSKEGLAQALLVLPQARLVERMKSVLAEEGDPVRTLEGLLDCLFDFCREDPDRARLMFAVFFGPVGAGLAVDVKKCGCELDQLWDEAVARLVAAGVVNASQAATFTLAMNGLHIIYILEFLYKDRPLDVGLPAKIVGDLLSGFEMAESRAMRLKASSVALGATGSEAEWDMAAG